MEKSTFTSNQATGGLGGAIDSYVNSQTGAYNSTLRINLDKFNDNSATYGGAVYSRASVNSSGYLNTVVTNTTFSGNQAVSRGLDLGGGVYINEDVGNNGSASATATLTNDTFFANQSDNHGGAIALELSTGLGGLASANLTSLTVNENGAATDSAGLYVDSNLKKTVVVNNSILSGNTVTAPGYKGPVDVTMTNNLALDDWGYNLVGTSDTMFTGDIETDTPGLATSLAQNGAPPGYPQTLALQTTSPGYEQGDPRLAGTLDERGFVRQNGEVSIGAEDPDGQKSTALRLNSSADPALAGQAVTLTAAVTSNGGIPTGTIAFYDGSTELAAETLDAYGNATYTTSSLALGSHNLTAVYGGDSNFNGSSGSLTQVISQETSSSLVLSSSANPSSLNQTVTFTATVSGGSGTPTGSVAFMDGDTTLGTASLDGSGHATLATAALALGSDTITAIYDGDATYGSSSASLAQTVNQASSSVTLTSSNSNAPPNQTVTFTANVTGMGGTPTGIVTFQDGTTVLGTGVLSVVNGQDQATFTTSTLALGPHDIIGLYGGDNTYSDSYASLTQSISLTASGTSLTSSANPSQPGQTVTFTAMVMGAGSVQPTGTVTFQDGPTVLGTGTLAVVNGMDQATFSTTALASGNHTITAIYDGDGTYASSDGSITQTVGQPSGNSSSTSVTSSLGTSQPGQAVTFTATVTGMGGTPTGTVTFQDGTTVLGSGTLAVVNGQDQATFSTSTLALGPHNIVALYGGDGSYDSSASSLTQTVALTATSLSLSSSASPALPGQAVTLTATILSSGTPTGSVTFYDGTRVLGTANVAVVNGQVQATLVTSFWDLGSHALFAVYSGDSTYAFSSSSLTEQVNQGGTTTSVTTSLNPSPQGQSVTFTATVAAMGMGAGTPTGTVSFYDGTTFLGTGTLALVNGQMQATFSTAVLGLGSHQIIAIYSGDSTFADSESSLQQTISS